MPDIFSDFPAAAATARVADPWAAFRHPPADLNALPWMGKVGDKLNRAYLGRNTGRLGDIILAPDSASQIGAIAARGAESPLAALFGRSALQAPAEARAR